KSLYIIICFTPHVIFVKATELSLLSYQKMQIIQPRLAEVQRDDQISNKKNIKILFMYMMMIFCFLLSVTLQILAHIFLYDHILYCS
ncbi:hypothetical protein ACJX0J_027095, partial [Zea mays]